MLTNTCVIKHANAGQKFKRIGHLDVNKVVWDDQQEIQPIIQSYAESCKIENIVARIALGDTTAVIGNRGEGIYPDKEIVDLAKKDAVTLEKKVTDIYLNAYKEFQGHDNISYNEFVKLMRAGKYDELSKFMKVEEKKEEVKDE